MAVAQPSPVMREFPPSPAGGRPACGEVWVGSKVLESRGFEDNPAGRAMFCRAEGMDAVCLAIAPEGGFDPQMGYRRFRPEEIPEAAESGLPCVVVIDGPFQQLTGQLGLMTALTACVQEPASVRRMIEENGAALISLAEKCARAGASAVIAADDLAMEQGPYMHPDRLAEMLAPIYREFSTLMRAWGVWPLFHSCGAIARLLPWLGQAGFEGLAAIQLHLVDPVDFGRPGGRPPVLIGGMQSDLFGPSLDPERAERFRETTVRLNDQTRLMLATSSGLYDPAMLPRWTECRRMIEAALTDKALI